MRKILSWKAVGFLVTVVIIGFAGYYAWCTYETIVAAKAIYGAVPEVVERISENFQEFEFRFTESLLPNPFGFKEI